MLLLLQIRISLEALNKLLVFRDLYYEKKRKENDAIIGCPFELEHLSTKSCPHIQMYAGHTSIEAECAKHEESRHIKFR